MYDPTKARLLGGASKCAIAPERKEGDLTAILEEVKKETGKFMSAFEEFKVANDTRIKEIEKKGAADPVTEAKLATLEAAMKKGEDLNAKLTTLENAAKAAAADAAEAKTRAEKLELRLNRPGSGGADPAALKAKHNLFLKASVKLITIGHHGLTEDERKAIDEVNAEMKSLAILPDTAGGYLAPTEYVREIIKAETEISPVRGLVRVRSTVNKSIQIPRRTGQFAAVWVAEQGTKSETTGLAYGLMEINAHEVYALIDISNQMLEDSAFDMEAELRMEASEQFAVAEGAALVSGSGVGRPEGFMASTSGVSTTNSGHATTVTADGLISLKHAVKTAYTANANYVMNRTTLGSVRKLKDGNGQYLWQPGIAAGKPNSIDGDPYVELPDMPSEGAGLKPVAYGDFRRGYTLVDRIAMEFLRDPYTQATGGNVRFIFRRRIGGQVTLAEAIRTLTCSAS